MKKIRLIELFAGIGTQASALRDIGADFEHHFIVEFDKSAIKSYNAIHGTNFEPLDIRNVKGTDLNICNKKNYQYWLTFSFPCQSLSLSGKRNGMVKGSGTASSLLWEVQRLLQETPEKPDYLIMENVTQVHTGKNLPVFNEFLSFLKSLGYSNTYFDLNAKNFGIPQNRKRCFMVSKLNDTTPFIPPSGVPLTKNIMDFLEDSVDEKNYLKDSVADPLINELLSRNYSEDPSQKSTEIITVGTLPSVKYRVNSPVLSKLGISTALLAHMSKDQMSIPKIVVASRGRNPDNPSDRTAGVKCKQRLEVQKDLTSNTLTTVSKDNYLLELSERPRIRTLTPKECWRLMGHTDEDFEKAKGVCPKTQLLKQAGNGIVKQCLMAIFEEILKEENNV